MDVNVQHGAASNTNTIQAPLPTYPQQTLPVTRSANTTTESNEPYSRLNDLQPSLVALSQPNLANISYSTNRLERPHSALSQK